MNIPAKERQLLKMMYLQQLMTQMVLRVLAGCRDLKTALEVKKDTVP